MVRKEAKRHRQRSWSSFTIHQCRAFIQNHGKRVHIACRSLWRSGLADPNFPWGKYSGCSAGDSGSIPGPGEFPGKELAIQYSCLGNPMDRRAWQAVLPRGRKSGHNWVSRPPPLYCCSGPKRASAVLQVWPIGSHQLLWRSVFFLETLLLEIIQWNSLIVLAWRKHSEVNYFYWKNYKWLFPESNLKQKANILCIPISGKQLTMKYISFYLRGSLVAQWEITCLPVQEMPVRSLDWEDPLEQEMTTHSSILAWEIPRQRVLADYSPWSRKRLGRDLATRQLHCLFIIIISDLWFNYFKTCFTHFSM